MAASKEAAKPSAADIHDVFDDYERRFKGPYRLRKFAVDMELGIGARRAKTTSVPLHLTSRYYLLYALRNKWCYRGKASHLGPPPPLTGLAKAHVSKERPVDPYYKLTTLGTYSSMAVHTTTENESDVASPIQSPGGEKKAGMFGFRKRAKEPHAHAAKAGGKGEGGSTEKDRSDKRARAHVSFVSAESRSGELKRKVHLAQREGEKSVGLPAAPDTPSDEHEDRPAGNAPTPVALGDTAKHKKKAKAKEEEKLDKEVDKGKRDDKLKPDAYMS